MPRDLLPTCDGSADRTVATCDPPEAVAYSYTVYAGWEDELAPGLGTTLILAAPGVGATVPGIITPMPTSIESDIAIAVPLGPVSSPPTPQEVPGSWQTVQPWTDVTGNPIIGLAIPAAFVPPSAQNPLWCRVRLRDEHGCITTAIAYFPEGLGDPAEWPVEAPAFVQINSLPFQAVTLPDALGIDNADSFDVADEAGVCPAPEQAVRVVPGCDGFPVEAELTIPEGGMPVVPAAGAEFAVVSPSGGPVEVRGESGNPLPVAGPGGGNVPVSIEDSAAVQLVVQADEAVGAAGGGGAFGGIPAGARMVVIGGRGPSDGAIVWTVMGSGVVHGLAWGEGTGVAAPGYRDVVIQAPPGFTLPAFELSATGGTMADTSGVVTGFYDP
jgi:hypothetical protein